MSKFKVGDILIGNDSNTYNVTNKSEKCKVMGVFPDSNSIQILMLEGAGEGHAYIVDGRKFDLVESYNPVMNFIKTDKGINKDARSVQLFSLGEFVAPNTGKIHDLSEYLIDSEGDLYSKNKDTYVTEYGVKLEKLSNNLAMNSLRDKRGIKVTIQRKTLKTMLANNAFKAVNSL